MANILEARGLHAGYGEVRVLKDVSVHVAQGSITAVIGSNGAGKLGPTTPEGETA